MSKVLQNRRRETLAALLRVGELESISPVLESVKRIADDPNADADQLAEAIRVDQGLAARVIKLANSAYYTVGRNKIHELRQAVVQLGFNSVKQLTMTAQVLDFMEDEGHEEWLPIDRFWAHSLACGLALAPLARRLGLPPEKDYFVIGFLHDIAKPVLCKYLPSKWIKVVESHRRNRDAIRMEVEVFGINHAEIGAWLLRMWRFPQEVFMAVGAHHHEGKGGGDLGLALVQANLLASVIMDTFPFGSRNRRRVSTQLARHGFTLQQINDLIDSIREEVLVTSEELELPLPDEIVEEANKAAKERDSLEE
ncbi:HDOD domain-containing protein [bacterium]|nr:HDOD domain-containing protein [bacterium]